MTVSFFSVIQNKGKTSEGKENKNQNSDSNLVILISMFSNSNYIAQPVWQCIGSYDLETDGVCEMNSPSFLVL